MTLLDNLEKKAVNRRFGWLILHGSLTYTANRIFKISI